MATVPLVDMAIDAVETETLKRVLREMVADCGCHHCQSTLARIERIAVTAAPPPPPDPIAELKAKARAEIEAEAARRKASDAAELAESAAVFREITDAIFAKFPALHGASIASHQSFTKHSDMTEVEVTVPGHRPFALKMTRVGGTPWQPVKTRPFSVRGPNGGDYCDDLGRALVLSEITS